VAVFVRDPPFLGTKNHMVFQRIYLSRYTLGFPRSSMVYASIVQAEADRPCPSDPLFTP
jgi:hypothetical protein